MRFASLSAALTAAIVLAQAAAQAVPRYVSPPARPLRRHGHTC